MTRRRRGGRVIGAGAAALSLALTACGADGTAMPTADTSVTTATLTTSADSGSINFDPCAALTPPFLAQRRWDARPPQPRIDNVGGSPWKGCAYTASGAYTFRVQTTDTTLIAVREKFPGAMATTVGGRRAMRYEARPDVPGGCGINVEMKSGSLYILVDDPRRAHPRGLSPCDNVTEIAEAVVPLLPEGS
ncbi:MULTISPECIES: DUF3558 domain-containing protein [Nocardia]|uniref:DUF3558 domain-containing protein n=1 Tax=Nocardia TaxID=1817 RepID=UPI001E4B0DE9|nr:MULTISPECIES: DUF3558 domain-containing protein [Nocardia]